MKQKLLNLFRLRAFALIAILCAGVSAAWGEEVTLAYSGSTTTNMTGNNDAATLGLSSTDWSVVGAKGNNQNFPGLNKSKYIALYYAENSSNTLTVSSLKNATINSIEITYTSNSYNNGKVLVGGNEVLASNGSYAINSTSFVVTNGNTSNVQVRISNIKIYYTPNSTNTCATPTFSPEPGPYTSPQDVTIECATDGATIYYTTNGNDPTTSSSVYSSPIAVSKTTTIKAIAVKSDKDNSSVATATYVIFEHAGTKNDPYTVADAREAIDANIGITDVYVTGIVSQIVTPWGQNDYQNITFNLIDNDGDEDFLQAFRCVGEEAASIQVNDVVLVKGNLTLYNTTYEFAQGCQLVSLEHSQSPTITFTPATIDLGTSNAIGAAISKTFTVSQINLTADITLSLQGDGELNPTSIVKGAETTTVTWTYTPTEVGEINATITATSTGAETQTLTISGAAVAPITGDSYEKVTEAPQDWSGCYIITGIYGDNYYALTGVVDNLGSTAAVTIIGDKIESNETTDAYRVIVAQTNNGYSLNMEGVGYLGYNSDATSSNNNLHALQSFVAKTCEWTIAYSSDGVTFTNVRNTSRKLQFNYNNGNSRFACYTSTQVKPTLFKYTGTVVLPSSISANNVEIAYDATSGEIAYTIENPVENVTLTATTTAEWISDIVVADDKVSFTATANTGDERTATITLTYGTVTKDVTLTQAAAPFKPATYTLASSITSGKRYIIVGEKDGSFKAMGKQNNNNRTAEDVIVLDEVATVNSADVFEFVIEGNDEDGYTIHDGKTPGYLYAASGSANYLKTETELDENGNGIWTIGFKDGAASIVAEGSSNRNVMQFNSANSLFACYASATQSPVYLFEKVEALETVKITITSAGAASFSSLYPLDFTNSGLTANIVTGKNGNYFTSQSVIVVPANTGLVVEGAVAEGAEYKTYNIPVATTTEFDDVSGNKLVGTALKAYTAQDGENVYGLFKSASTGKVGFQKKAEGFSFGVGKSYLRLTDSEAKGAEFIYLNEVVTGIKTVSNEQMESGNRYNLNGQRVDKSYKGVVIVNGKKMINK